MVHGPLVIAFLLIGHLDNRLNVQCELVSNHVLEPSYGHVDARGHSACTPVVVVDDPACLGNPVNIAADRVIL